MISSEANKQVTLTTLRVAYNEMLKMLACHDNQIGLNPHILEANQEMMEERNPPNLMPAAKKQLILDYGEVISCLRPFSITAGREILEERSLNTAPNGVRVRQLQYRTHSWTKRRRDHHDEGHQFC